MRRTLPPPTVELIGQLNLIADLFAKLANGDVPSAVCVVHTCRQAAIRLDELANALEELAPFVAGDLPEN